MNKVVGLIKNRWFQAAALGAVVFYVYQYEEQKATIQESVKGDVAHMTDAKTGKKILWFTPKEFGIWYPYMDKNLLEKLEALRAGWKNPILISPAIGALGRVASIDNATERSMHMVWQGKVRAADIFPTIMDTTYNKMRPLTKAEQIKFYNLAKSIGFTGIGVYPDWYYNKITWCGFHVDVRPTYKPGSPANWLGKAGKFGMQVYSALTSYFNG